VKLGEYVQLKQLYHKMRKSKNKNISKDVQVVEHRLVKDVLIGMLNAILTCVEEQFNQTMIEPGQQKVNPSLTLSSKDEFPELLKETFDIYNKFARKEAKKVANEPEQDRILHKCIFMMRCIYDGPKNKRYLLLNDYRAKLEGASECNNWYKNLKSDHENARKEQIVKTLPSS
jgi:hypothetical protein